MPAVAPLPAKVVVLPSRGLTVIEPLSTERWRQIKDIVEKAWDCATEDRSAYLRQACGGSAELRAAVDALLASDQSASDFLKPVQVNWDRMDATADGSAPAQAEDMI